MWENCHDYNPELEKEWSYKAKDVPRMITALRMQLHHLRENGYYPRAIMVNQEGLDALLVEWAKIDVGENPIEPREDPGFHDQPMAYTGLPVHFVPKLGSTFLIGV